MAREIFYGEEGFAKLLSGAKQMNDAVVVTMGARGRNVLIEGPYDGDIAVTKDGVTVAKNIQLKDPTERLASNLLRNASVSTNDKCGDGTTSTVSLAYAILKHGAESVKNGHNPILLKRGIDIELKETLKYLEAMKEPINDDMDKVRQIAYISANGDDNVADVVTEVYSKVGVHGNVAIEADLHKNKITYEKIEGIEFDRGYNHPYYITDIEHQKAVYENPMIVVSDYRVQSIQEIKNVLEIAVAKGRPFVLIAEDIDPQVDSLLAANKMSGIPIVTINAPEFGDRRLHFLEDIATITGGKFISRSTNLTYDDVKEDFFGECEKIIVDREDTSIIGGKGDKEAIQARIKGVYSQIANAKEPENKKWLEKRYAKLEGGVVVIRVGANSDIERRELKDRVEDAVNAVKCAMLDGIVIGGGTALMKISLAGIEGDEPKESTTSEMMGRRILKEALKTPFNQILVNAGLEPDKIAKLIIENGEEHVVFDVANNKLVNGIESGIIDPVLVTKTALVNATSVAGTLLTTQATIVYEKPMEDVKLS